MEDTSVVENIKMEMNHWFGFELTDEQVDEYLNEHPDAKHFDTVERGDFANHIAKKITGMNWPINMDSEEYKQEFFKKLKENSESMGYVCN